MQTMRVCILLFLQNQLAKRIRVFYMVAENEFKWAVLIGHV